MDCGSLLPLSVSQPAADGNMTAQHASQHELELSPAWYAPALHVVVPQQAASTKAAAGCRSPRWLRHVAVCMLVTTNALAGPYAPAAGQAGSTAIHRSDSRIVAWGNRVMNYAVGTDCVAQWQDTAKCLGPAGDDATQITCLGAGGTITLAFPGFIKNGAGPDFVIFENALNDNFLELAYVEVSRDGVSFVRLPNHSATASAVGTYGGLDPTDIQGLGCKYRQPYGEPYDLADVGLDQVAYVRLVDVKGDGTSRDSENRVIYDAYPNVLSAGFDLDAIGVLNLQTWQTMTVATLSGNGTNATAFAHLPDGRFLLGAQGQLSVQSVWGQPARVVIPNGNVEFDPSFIAVRSASEALLGEGGGFGNVTGVHRFNPTVPTTPVVNAAFANLQNFSGTWWKSPSSGREGWIIGGGNGPTGKHRLTYLSADGSKSGFLTTDLSTFSSGLTTDAQGNVFFALYEVDGSPAAAQSDVVRKFNASQIDASVAAILAGNSAPLTLGDSATQFKFTSASSLAVDALGRIWASGFKATDLQVYDPNTGASLRIQPNHDSLGAGTEPIYQVQTFAREGEDYIAFLVSDEYGTPGTPIIHGLTSVDAITVPDTLASWQAFQFGAGNLTANTASTLWGSQADPDGDGLGNLLEYAFHTLPQVANSSPVQLGQSLGRLTIAFPRDPLHTDLTYSVEASADLSANSWITLASSVAGNLTQAVSPAAPLISEAPSGKLQLVTVRDIVAIGTTPRFLRVRITKP